MNLNSRVRTSVHFHERCTKRGVPHDAADIVTMLGERLPTVKPNSKVWHFSRLAALRASQRGMDRWNYAGVVVVMSAQNLAVRTYRIDEAEAIRLRHAAH